MLMICSIIFRHCFHSYLLIRYSANVTDKHTQTLVKTSLLLYFCLLIITVFLTMKSSISAVINADFVSINREEVDSELRRNDKRKK